MKFYHHRNLQLSGKTTYEKKAVRKRNGNNILGRGYEQCCQIYRMYSLFLFDPKIVCSQGRNFETVTTFCFYICAFSIFFSKQTFEKSW